MNENERHLRDNYFDASRQSPQSQMSSNYLNYQPNSEEPTTQNENFSFLSDGRGNFLKIYYEGRGQNIPKKYELFSNESNPTFTGSNVDKGTNQNFYSHYQSQEINQVPSHEMHFPQAQQQQNQPPITNAPQSQNKTNMLINQLIHQWTPNMSGTYQPFGEPTGFSIMTSAPNLSAQTPSTVDANQPVGCFTETAENVVLNDFTNKENIHNSAINKPADDGTAKPNIQTRKRIIAEVKPMRMSYSDVLNKNIINDGQPPVSNDSTINTNVQNGNGSVPVHPSVKNFKGDKMKFASNFEKKTIEMNDKTNNVQQQKIKKNIVNNENINPINTANISNNEKNKKLNTSAGNNIETKIDKNNKTNNNENKDKSKKKEKPMTTKNGMNMKMSGNQSSSEMKSGNVSGGKKKLGKPKKNGRDEFDDDDDEDYDDSFESDSEDNDDANNSDYYNVRKNNSDGQQHKIEKIKQTQNLKKTKTIKEPRIQTKPEKTQKRMGKTAINRKRQKHEILLKLITSSWNYLLVFLKWLYSLIVDVVYLSFGIIYDRLLLGYQAVRQFYTNVQSEIKSNSGKPGVWLKNMWKKFDGKFERKSKWAFWRYFSERKKLREQEQVNKNLFKDGKLPTTADEAMKSLLNCKGKDAYSILGVSPNCSQEQIRKHYKKIAVLVHPDKNKQAGAEEAFKILQRSFELIGETESRKRYDLSLAEALNAEKAFSELNDLLVQLQTKISEAANTIRCSSCCLRHPRRPTGRKPFSARECSTCKIRHPAREGDIWAETTMLGLRWKYLALMEGVVYDITEWANCQKTQLSHLQPNSCVVQYKIVLGGNQQNQTQSQQTSQFEREKHKKDNPTANDPSFDDFLNNIYAGQTQSHHNPNTRRRYKRN